MKPTPPPLSVSLARLALRLAIVAALVWAVLALMDWVMGHIGDLPGASGEHLMLGFLVSMLLAYAILIAVPYVPGIEIGVSLLVMKGAAVAPFVYVATVTGLMLAFAAGRFLRDDWLRGLLADLRLGRAAALVGEMAPLGREERLARLRAALPDWAAWLAGGGRYVLLALLLNVPGNGIVGGGGGICLIAGLSRLFGLRGTLAAIALGVAPVPLAVWLFGTDALL